MRARLIITALLGLTAINVFYLFSERSLESVNDILPNGSYISKLNIISKQQQNIGEELFMLAVNDEGLSLQIQRVYNQCVSSNLYAFGSISQHKEGVVIEFTKVNEQSNDSCTPSLKGPMDTVNTYAEEPLLFRATYQRDNVYCFESDYLGGICLNKE